MTDLRRVIARADLNEALRGGVPGLYCAVLFDNPKLESSDWRADNTRLPPAMHALVCAMLLMTDSSQDGVPAVIERHGHTPCFAEGIRLLGWPELDVRLTKFLRLMEPYTRDQEWWSRFSWLEDAGAFKEFEDWFWANELEFARRIECFFRENENACVVVEG